MRQSVVAAWLTAVVALSAAVRRADDPPRSTSGSKLGRHVGFGGHVTPTERYINRKLQELETRFGRKLVEQAKRLNHSITIHYLEKVTLTITINIVNIMIAYCIGYFFSTFSGFSCI